MSLVNILNVTILDNPAPFKNPIQLEITFEALGVLEEDLEWKIVYVGSAESEAHDQLLDSVMVGPVPVGVNKFVFQTDSPNADLIPKKDAIGATVLLLTCSYLGNEFVRVGYYVNNEYSDPELQQKHNEGLLEDVYFDKLFRNILAEKPRVTRFPIPWTKEQLNMAIRTQSKTGVANEILGFELPPVESSADDDIAFEIKDGVATGDIDMEHEEEESKQRDKPSEDMIVEIEA